jgi:hypothetical protein
MKLKEKNSKRKLDAETEAFVSVAIYNYYDGESDRRVDLLAEMFGRLLDHMNLHDQQKLDIIEPYSDWELDK